MDSVDVLGNFCTFGMCTMRNLDPNFCLGMPLASYNEMRGPNSCKGMPWGTTWVHPFTTDDASQRLVIQQNWLGAIATA